MAEVTKPIALDETLQRVASACESMAENAQQNHIFDTLEPSEGVDTHTNAPSISAVKGETTAINGKIGDTDISSIGDGTITGALSQLKKFTFSLVVDKDLNDYKTSGLYYCNGCIHCPATYFQMLIIGSGGDCCQIGVQIGTSNIWIRSYDGVQWSDWVQK